MQFFASTLFESVEKDEPSCVEPCTEPAPLPVVESSTVDATDNLDVELEEQGGVSMTDDPIWSYVSPCSARDASKSTVIRNSLV